MKRLLSLCFLLPLLVGCNSGPKVTLLPDSQFDTIIDGKKSRALYVEKCQRNGYASDELRSSGGLFMGS